MDVAAEIFTVKVIGDAVDKTLESEVQKQATAKEQAIAQIMQLAETKAIKDILAEASSTPSPTSNNPGQTPPSAAFVATEILAVKTIGGALDKSLESQVQAEANTKEQAIAQVMKLAQAEAIKGILADANKRPVPNLRPPYQPPSNLNIPTTLDFESGSGDNDNEISGTRDKVWLLTLPLFVYVPELRPIT